MHRLGLASEIRCQLRLSFFGVRGEAGCGGFPFLRLQVSTSEGLGLEPGSKVSGLLGIRILRLGASGVVFLFSSLTGNGLGMAVV